MSAHTPGPWTALEFPDEKFVEVRANEGYSIVAHVFFNNGNRDETARLIVAAPELLEALSKAVRETEQFLFDAWLVRVCPSGDVESVQRQWLASSDHREFVDEWREQIDAIAKATGGAA